MVTFTSLGIFSFTCSLLWCFHLLLQELSKIAMPVVFNEPLSFLQRISEYMEHTHLIHKACGLSDSIDRMQVDIKGSDIMYLSVCHVFLFLSSLWAINEPRHTAPKYSVAHFIRKRKSNRLWFISFSYDSLLLHLLFRQLHLNGKGLESHLILCWERHTSS